MTTTIAIGDDHFNMADLTNLTVVCGEKVIYMSDILKIIANKDAEIEALDDQITYLGTEIIAAANHAEKCDKIVECANKALRKVIDKKDQAELRMRKAEMREKDLEKELQEVYAAKLES